MVSTEAICNDLKMLETIDGGAKSRNQLTADTSWEPDFEEPDDFASNDNVAPNIITPSESAVECSFDGWALSDNEMEAINEYSKQPVSDNSPPPPPNDTDVTARITNVKTLNTSTDSGAKKQSKLSKAKQKYEKLVKGSPKSSKKAASEENKEEAKGAAAKRRERRESKKDKFKKMVKYKSNTPTKKAASPDPKVFDPWLTAAEATPAKEEEKEEDAWENAGEEWARDEQQELEQEKIEQEKVEEQEMELQEKEQQGGDIVPLTPVKTAKSDIKNQDIFRPKGGSSVMQPSPASKEINDVLKDVQANLEVSAITKSSSLIYDDEADFEYDFNELTPDKDFQSKIEEQVEIADDAGSLQASVQEVPAAAEEEAEKPPEAPGKMAFFTCGMIDVEVASPKQVMVDFTRDLKTGMRNSVRNFFGQCDVGEGADVVAKNVQETKKNWKENVNVSRDHTKDYVGFGFKKE